jgi:hypothetical protein
MIRTDTQGIGRLRPKALLWSISDDGLEGCFQHHRTLGTSNRLFPKPTGAFSATLGFSICQNSPCVNYRAGL